MRPMADRSGGGGGPRQRIKTLTQAAMNADVTVNQLEDVLGGLGDSLTDLNKSLTHLNTAVDRLNSGLDHFEATLSRIDDLMGRLATLVAPVEAVVEGADRIRRVPRGAIHRIPAADGAGDRLATDPVSVSSGTHRTVPS